MKFILEIDFSKIPGWSICDVVDFVANSVTAKMRMAYYRGNQNINPLDKRLVSEEINLRDENGNTVGFFKVE